MQRAATPQGSAASEAAAPKAAALSAEGAPGSGLREKKVMLVYYIGGVTFGEIAALRFLSDKPDFPFRIIICTTKLINGNSFVKDLFHSWESAST